MTWLVFGVSILLVLAGAVSIISGAPIIQLERGWAEVISGAVALSSGGVVFALALVLLRLEALREALVARAGEPLATPGGVSIETLTKADALAVADQPAVPDLPPEPIPSVPEPAPAAAADGALWKRIRRPAEQPDVARLEQGGFPDRVAPDAEAPQQAAAAPVIVPPHPTPGDAGAGAPAAAEPAEPAGAGRIGWLERSIGAGRTSRPRPAETGAAPAASDPVLPSLFGDPAPARAERREPSLGAAPGRLEPTRAAPAPEPALEPEPMPDVAAESHAGVSVIGRYQAGTSSYVMYSDGTIEVETEEGQVHRFGSMEELKAYIASQETPAG